MDEHFQESGVRHSSYERIEGNRIRDPLFFPEREVVQTPKPVKGNSNFLFPLRPTFNSNRPVLFSLSNPASYISVYNWLFLPLIPFQFSWP